MGFRTGLLLSLPTDSIAIRLVIASLVAVVLARLLLQAGLRVPRVRAGVAIVPAVAMLAVAVAVVLGGSLSLPSLWVPVDAAGALPVPIRDTYVTFAPAAVPLLLGLWGSVVVVRLVRRVRRAVRTRAVVAAARTTGTAPGRLVRTVERLAVGLRVTPPDVAVIEDCPGGAGVVGVRSPVLLVDRDLLARLDPCELDGVVAHELAHVRRRDNLLASLLGLLRDVAFFVPGGRWCVTRLLAERELAADQVAVDCTGRPGALASGLLKVLEGADRRVADACSPLLPAGTLVGRVQLLCDDQPAPSRLRSSLEVVAAATVVGMAVTAAVEVPDLVAGEARERDALGLMWSEVSAGAGEEAGEARAFAAYRESPLEVATTPDGTGPVELDDADAMRPSVLEACTLGSGCAQAHEATLVPFAPRPRVVMDEALVEKWRVDPFVRSDSEELAAFWFRRLE